MKWWDWMPWSQVFECWVLSQLLLSSFTLKRLLSSSSLSAVRLASSAYMRLLIFLPAVLIPTCASCSLAFCMMYSAYELNKQGDSIQPWRTPFPIWNRSVVPCLVLTVASWPGYRFLRRQVVWYSHLLKSFPQFVVIYTVKGFGVVNKAEVHVFPGILLFFSMIQWVSAIWSLVPLPFLNLARTSGIWQFTVCEPWTSRCSSYI